MQALVTIVGAILVSMSIMGASDHIVAALGRIAMSCH